MSMITRRSFLAGLGGAVVALPMLESMRLVRKPRAHAQEVREPVYSVFVRQGNGVAQAVSGRGEPERFWPAAHGPLSQESLTSGDNAGRTISVLAPYADRLIAVSGTRYGFPGEGCGHSGGLNQCLTAARVVGSGADSLANGESVDWFISRHLNPPGTEPLTLMSGPQEAYIAHGLSYSGPRELRGAQNNPLRAYQALVGLGDAPPELVEQIALRRTSVNDLVREEMRDLVSKRDLSAGDRRRLETHFDAIRDFEINLSCNLTDGEVVAMETVAEAAADNANRITVALMMMDLVALAFACDLNRTATLQIGTGNDQTRYYVDGELQNTFHRISHRVDSDGSDGPTIPDADRLHHEIDKQFAEMFLHLLDRLEGYTGPSGASLLDDSVAVWTNDLADGPPHSYRNLPHVVAGRASGFLRTGQYLDAGDVTHNQFLNTIINAVGIRDSSGRYYDSFGDPDLERGVIDAMIAS
jgi:hypothetical protein